MPPSVRFALFSVCDWYPLIFRKKLGFSVSQDSVIIIKVNRVLTRFKLVMKSANLPVVLRAFAVRTDKLLYIRFYLAQTIEHQNTGGDICLLDHHPLKLRVVRSSI